MNCLQDDHSECGGSRNLHPNHPKNRKSADSKQPSAAAASTDPSTDDIISLSKLVNALDKINSSKDYNESPHPALDSAASHHFVINRSMRTNMKNSDQNILATEANASADGIGNAELSIDGRTLNLLNSYFVPKLRRSLISASKLDK